MALSPLVERYEQLIIDLDGCVWLGDEAIEGSVEAIERLREAGKRLAFATNNSRRTGEDYVRKLWGMGIQASLGDVVTVGGATQHLLAETRRGMTAFVIGTDAMLRHVADAGLRLMNGTDLATRAELVIVSGTEDVTYDDIRIASAGAPPRGRLPGDQPRSDIPDAGRAVARHRGRPGSRRGGERPPGGGRRQARASALPDGARAAWGGPDAGCRGPHRVGHRGRQARAAWTPRWF